MSKRLVWLVLCLFPGLAFAQNNVAGDWIVRQETHGIPFFQRLTLTFDNGKLGGSFNGGDIIDGSVSGNSIHFVDKDRHNGNVVPYSGNITGADTMEFDRGEISKLAYKAERMPRRPPGPPQRHEFAPTDFAREFSPFIKPVLTIWPGDTIHTTTVDATGKDEHGVSRVFGGNPETGPFYIQTAMPGDVLAIHFTRIRLNRDWAFSDDFLVPRASDLAFARKLTGTGFLRWKLDLEHGVATTTKPGDHLKNFSIPVRPMMGCIAVAPRFSEGPVNATDSGPFGGNMDLNEIVEGTTVYLPVYVPGALLYVGDGHALQGDGELNGNALETSMDVEFTVDVLHEKSIKTPRVETSTHIIALGLDGSMEGALRAATGGMAEWLEQDYDLSPSEIVQLLGVAVEYSASEVADRNAGIAAKLNKKYLASLTPGKPDASTKHPATP